jgi:ATP-dependent Clp protease ATP-binding subunit ClpA
MLALYRCDRQTEALELYRRMRQRLVEDLAHEPSPRLRNLEKAMLTQDSELNVASPSEPSSPPAHLRKSTRDEYWRDLNELAHRGKLDPVIGRRAEIDQTIEILARRIKNNPLLIGPPVVGKTAIVEAAARRIVDQPAPDVLRGKQIYYLDRAVLAADARSPGDFDERLKHAIEELFARRGEVIAFVDGLDKLVGAHA